MPLKEASIPAPGLKPAGTSFGGMTTGW